MVLKAQFFKGIQFGFQMKYITMHLKTVQSGTFISDFFNKQPVLGLYKIHNKKIRRKTEAFLLMAHITLFGSMVLCKCALQLCDISKDLVQP